ncbi:MAG: hypothetical protein U0132_13445 [Gemmatimonadaceae bacterium]
MKKIARTFCLALLLPGAQLAAQTDGARPNFTGSWKLVQEISPFNSPMPNLVHRIEHSATSFAITIFENDTLSRAREAFEIDGPEVELPSTCCGPGMARVWWEGTRGLKASFAWKGGSQEDMRSLTNDGKTMTQERTIKEGGVQRVIIWVYEKQL